MTTSRNLAAICVVLAVVAALPGRVEALPTRASVEQEIDRLANEISRLDEEFNVARLELQKSQARIRDAEERKASAAERTSNLRSTTAARGVAIYRAGRPKLLLALLTSKDPVEFNRRVGMITSVASWEAQMVESLTLSEQKFEQINAELQKELALRRSIRDRIGGKRSAIERRIAEQKQVLVRLEQADLAAVRARKAAAAALALASLPPLPSSPRARVAVETAYAQIGKPYRYGASGPDSFDCSGLTMYSWGKAGVSLPHSSRAQYSATRRVARGDVQAGDLVFFGSPIHHVGIYIGEGRMINSPETGDSVGIRSIDRRDYAGAGRPGV